VRRQRVAENPAQEALARALERWDRIGGEPLYPQDVYCRGDTFAWRREPRAPTSTARQKCAHGCTANKIGGNDAEHDKPVFRGRVLTISLVAVYA
jgi:hypothetical protein